MLKTRPAVRGIITLFAATAATAAAFVVPAGAATAPTVGFSGYAYGTYANVQGGAVTSGPSALVSVGCTTTGGIVRTTHVASVVLPQLGTVGAVSSSILTFAGTTGRATAASADVNTVNLAGGLVTATAVGARSRAAVDTGGSFTGTASSVLTGLKVGGIAVAASTAPNTVIALKVAGVAIGRVTVNEQVKGPVTGGYRVQTVALHVVISSVNPLKITPGTQVLVGVANSALTAPTSGYVSGGGFATKATTLQGVVSLGQTATANLSCFSATNTNTVATVNLPSLLTTGAATTTAVSVVGSTTVSGEVTDRISGLNVLNGLITATTITSHTKAAKTGSAATVLNDTSAFAGLTIKGVAYANANVHPNTIINVAGLGTITLHKVSRTTTALTVTMMEIKLSNSIGALPTGTTIIVSYSSSRVVNSL